MEAFHSWLNSLVNNNKSDFAEYSGINWINPYNADTAIQQREELLKKLDKSMLFKDTKPYHKQISEGCRICGSGQWSCLFITGKCNAGCFYCPAPQTTDEIPSTQGLNFDNPQSYAAYVDYLNFKGVSFSGGEPLLYFQRTLDYLKEVKKRCSNTYTWMYTNGILSDKEKLKQLALAGLDEVRFDIGATGFRLDHVKMAKGITPNITIEIPAVPEEKERLIKLLPEMIKRGVTNLNLHQLRLTKHNARNLLKRQYTYINAEKPIVLESELAALEIVDYARQHNLDIGLNYCSFFFKHRFQKAGFRKQVARAIGLADNCITENGYIREYNHQSIIYKTIKMLDDKPSDSDSYEIVLDGKIYYYRFFNVFVENNLSNADKQRIDELLRAEPVEIPTEQLLFSIWQKEYIEKGLREY